MLEPLETRKRISYITDSLGGGRENLNRREGGEISTGGEAGKILIRVCFIFQHAF